MCVTRVREGWRKEERDSHSFDSPNSEQVHHMGLDFGPPIVRNVCPLSGTHVNETNPHAPNPGLHWALDGPHGHPLCAAVLRSKCHERGSSRQH